MMSMTSLGSDICDYKMRCHYSGLEQWFPNWGAGNAGTPPEDFME